MNVVDTVGCNGLGSKLHISMLSTHLVSNMRPLPQKPYRLSRSSLDFNHPAFKIVKRAVSNLLK